MEKVPVRIVEVSDSSGFPELWVVGVEGDFVGKFYTGPHCTTVLLEVAPPWVGSGTDLSYGERITMNILFRKHFVNILFHKHFRLAYSDPDPPELNFPTNTLAMSEVVKLL